MYQVPKDRQLDGELIQNAINFNEERRARFNLLDNYYLGNQSILDRKRDEDASAINNKLMVNHAKYITEVSVGYLLGNPVDYQVCEGVDILPILDAYKSQTMDGFDIEIAKDCSIFGMAYEYIYADENTELKSVQFDVRNTIIVYDDTIAHNKLYGLNYRPVFEKPTDKEPKYYEVLALSTTEIITGRLESKNGKFKEIDRTAHSFGVVPIIEYKNNKEYQGDFEPVISLIDAYNLIQSDRVNDREQLVDAILCFYGMSFDLEQMGLLKTHRAISSIPTDGRVEYLTKQVSEADVDVLRQNIEKDIHKISMVPNMSDENFVGNSSGVALRYKLLTFEQKIKNKERLFEVGLLERFEIYSKFFRLNSKLTEDIDIKDVDAIFKRNLPQNDLETSQMINNLQGLVDNELLVAQLSFVDNAAETVEIAKQQQEEATPIDTDYNANQFGDINEETQDQEI